MLDQEKLFKILGFAQRAQKLTLGFSATSRLLSRGKVRAVIIAADLSANSRANVEAVAQKMAVPVFVLGTKDQLGKQFGRKELGIIGIADAAFMKAIRDSLHEQPTTNRGKEATSSED